MIIASWQHATTITNQRTEGHYIMKGQARNQGGTGGPCPRQMPVPPLEMTKNKKIDAFTHRPWSDIK